MGIKNLLWIDGIGALIAGTVVMCLKEWLSGILGLPEQILLIQSIITLAYGAYSTTLAIKKIYRQQPVRILGTANFVYVAFVMMLFINTFESSAILGKAYFLVEMVYISALAILELRQLKYLK